MRGGATAPPLLPLIALLGVAGGGADAQVTSHESYAGQVLLRTVHANLGNVMEQPFGVIRFSQASVDPLDFLDTGSTEALRTWMYQQTVAVGLGDRERTSMDMIYYGGEDGRFVGYFSHTSYTERGRGYGMAADLPWAPYELADIGQTMALVNVNCTGAPACRGESGKNLSTSPMCTGTSTAPGSPTCDLDPVTDGSVSCLAGCTPGGCPGSWDSRSGSCTNRLHEAVDAANEATCLAGPDGNTWFAPCNGTCCDNNVRNYYGTSIERRGAPGDFTRWRNYDPRHRTWYKQQRRDYLERNLTTGWSSMYEFSTSQALGLSAMAVAADPDTEELLGVFAIDYDVGAISSIITGSLSGVGAWTFAVERSNGKLVGISTGEQLYNRTALKKNGGTLSFFESRLSAVASNHSAVAAAAAMLADQGWPELHHREGGGNIGYEFSSRLLTGSNGLDWLVVAGQSFSCASDSTWKSVKGQCERCDVGKAPKGRECVSCARSQRVTADGAACVCPEGTYDSWRPLESARAAIGNASTSPTDEFEEPPSGRALHVFVWPGRRRWVQGRPLEADEFNQPWSEERGNPRCEPCPLQGVGCSGGVARPWAGYTEVEASSTEGFDLHFMRCRVDELEEPTSTEFRCIGVQGNSSSAAVPAGLSGVVGTCAANHTGMLCASCVEGTGKERAENTCEPCEPLTFGNVLATLALLVGIAVLLLVLHYYWIRSSMHHLARVAFQPGRILVSYGQVTSQLGSVLDTRYPGWFGGLIDGLRPIMEPWSYIFNFLQPRDCLTVFGVRLGGFHSRWIMSVLMQPALLCLLVVAAHRVRPEQVDLRGCLFMVLFFCYPTMNSVSLAAWICVDLTGDKRRMLLVEDDRVECEDTQHDIYQVLTVVVVAGVGVFIPLAFTYVLWRQSKENVQKRHAFRMKELAEELQVPLKDVKVVTYEVMMEGYSFLMGAYKPSVIWWESVDMLRKLALVGLVLLLGPGSSAQLWVGLLLTVTFSAALVGIWPYKDRAATELHIFFAISTAMVLHSRTKSALDRERLGSEFYDNFLIISFALLVPLALVGTVVMKLRNVVATMKEESKTGSARFELKKSFDLQLLGMGSEEHRATLRRFLLGWDVKKTYACFLSHYKWEAGTDAALLHAELLNAMPGLSPEQLFLDSNNLDNLDNLPGYVVGSDCVVLLLTANVLKRPYVLLELYTATEANIPLVILQMDSGHAGKAGEIASFLRDFPAWCERHPECGDVLKKLPRWPPQEGPAGIGISPTEMQQVLQKGLRVRDEKDTVGKRWDLVRKSSIRASQKGWAAAIRDARTVLSFNSQASDTVKQTQMAALTKAIVTTACPENRMLQALNDFSASATLTEIHLEAAKSIRIIHDGQPDALEQVRALRTWLTEHTDLEDDQLLAMSDGHTSPAGTGVESADSAAGRVIATIRAGDVAAVILLQTASVLHDPECLAVLHTALTADIKLIPVRLCFAEPEKDPLHYDFEQQHAHIADLGEGLSKAAMNTLEELTLANTDDVSKTLSSHVPNAISKFVATDPGAAERQTQLLDVARTLRMQLLSLDSAAEPEPEGSPLLPKGRNRAATVGSPRRP